MLDLVFAFFFVLQVCEQAVDQKGSKTGSMASLKKLQSGPVLKASVKVVIFVPLVQFYNKFFPGWHQRCTNPQNNCGCKENGHNDAIM